MQPFKFTVHNVFDRERRHVVPLFQRPYVWDADKQWEPLWEDIERHAERAWDAHRSGAPFNGSHFLGAIVLRNATVIGGGIAPSEIIDGQQRLTTLQIFLAGFRDFAKALGADDLARDVDRLTRNERRNLSLAERFKLWPTNADRVAFEKAMTAGERKAVAAEDRVRPSKITKAYLFFYDRVAEFSTGATEENKRVPTFSADDQKLRLDALEKAITSALQLVVIELEEQDNPQVIFETLNGRGEPLLPSDLIRNLIFLDAIDAESLYNTYWRGFDEILIPGTNERYWHKPVRQGRLERPRIDLFLFHYLVMMSTGATKAPGDHSYSDKELNIGELFRRFQDWWRRRRQQTTTAELLKDIQETSVEFRKLVTPEGGDRLAAFARRLLNLDTSTPYPVLLFLLRSTGTTITEAERDEIVADIESYLVRRFVCQLTPKNYNNLFVSLLKELKEAAARGGSLPQEARKFLLRQTGSSSYWPQDAEFEQGWLTKPVYVNSRKDRCQMLLLAMENAVRNRKNERMQILQSLTVEHLLPQNPEVGTYPFPVESALPLKEGESNEARRSVLIHTVGNLTLLTQELNSSVSNGPFPAKAAAIGQDSDLRLNARFREVQIGTSPSWSEIDVLSRGKELFQYAVAVWPHPGADAEKAAREITLDEVMKDL